MKLIRTAGSRLLCLLFFAVFSILIHSSCSAQTKGIKLYTEGLKSLDQKNKDEALVYFSKAKEQGSELIKELSQLRIDDLTEGDEKTEETISSLVAKKNYAAASELLDSNLSESQITPEEYLANQSAENLSDLGKIYLYYRRNFEVNALVWENAFLASQNDTNRFMLLFYSARLRQRMGSKKDIEKALNMFELAMQFAQSDENYDSALYYYLQCSLQISVKDLPDALEKYGSTMKDPSWFSDFFDQYSALLLENNLWHEYYRTYRIVEKVADNRTVSMYAYVTGLLIENELLFLDSDCQTFYEQAYRRADGTDFYRVVSAKKLKAPVDYKESNITENLEWDNTKQKEFMQLSEYLFSLGMDSWLYKVWNENKNKINFANVLILSKKFSSRINRFEANMTRSIRIAVNAAVRKNYHVDKEHLRMLYPLYYKNEISSACEEFRIDKNLLFALVRSESFFNPDAISSAGAVGLTQLMYPTAQDVAKKLKAKDYDLKEPAVNVRFGGAYLAEMIRRLEGQEIAAVCAYNAGISRVRQWISKYGMYGTELFIEMIPYAETREYARKIIGTEFIYSYLELR